MAINIFILKGELNGKIVVVRFFFCWVYISYKIIWASSQENLALLQANNKVAGCRSACASAQSDQQPAHRQSDPHLCYSLPEKYDSYTHGWKFKISKILIFMPPKELWEAYSNRTVRPSVRPSVRQSVRPAFVSGPYLLYSLR